MRKSVIALSVLAAFAGSAFALTVDENNSPYTENIDVGSEGLINSGTIKNDSVIIRDGGQFQNTGSIETQILDISTTNSPSPKFEGTITAHEKIVFWGAGSANSYADGFILTAPIKTALLEIRDAKFLNPSATSLGTGLTIEDPDVFKGIGAIHVIGNGLKTGLRIGRADDGKIGQNYVVEAPVVLENQATTQDARVEIFNGNHVRFNSVTGIGDKALLQLNDSATASIENLTVAKDSRLTFQTLTTGDPVDKHQSNLSINEVTLEENAKLQVSNYRNNRYAPTNPVLTITGQNVTINMAKNSVADFGAYKNADNHDWAPEDVYFAVDSLTVNVADSRSDTFIYFSGVDGHLQTKVENIHLIADASNNTGNPEADLQELADVAWTNTKEGEEKVNTLKCLGGITVEQEASDIYDGATATVAKDCPNCTITNVRTTANPNINGIAEMAALGIHIWRNEIDDMHRRVGELRDNSDQSNGVWTRVYTGKAKYGNQSVENKFTAFQFGYDRQLSEGFWLGGAFSYTYGDNDFRYGEGDSNLYAFSGYGSWLADNGFYLDVVGKVGRIKNGFDIAYNDIKSSADYHTNAVSLSAEAGWRYFATESLFIEPQVQMWYGHVFDAQYDTSTGIAVENDSVDSLVGRVGIKLGFKDLQGRGSAFLKASVLHDWEGDAEYFFRKGNEVSRTLTESLGGTWCEYGVGADFNATKQVRLYADVEVSDGGEVDTDYRVNLGIRYAW